MDFDEIGRLNPWANLYLNARKGCQWIFLCELARWKEVGIFQFKFDRWNAIKHEKPDVFLLWWIDNG